MINRQGKAQLGHCLFCTLTMIAFSKRVSLAACTVNTDHTNTNISDTMSFPHKYILCNYVKYGLLLVYLSSFAHSFPHADTVSWKETFRRVQSFCPPSRGLPVNIGESWKMLCMFIFRVPAWGERGVHVSGGVA